MTEELGVCLLKAPTTLNGSYGRVPNVPLFHILEAGSLNRLWRFRVGFKHPAVVV
jgi:hypothetical protein